MACDVTTISATCIARYSAVEHMADFAMAPLKDLIIPMESASRHGKNQGEKSSRRTRW